MTSVSTLPNNRQLHRWLWVCLVLGLMWGVALLGRTALPIFVILPAGPHPVPDMDWGTMWQRLRVLLPDDVMITLRAATILSETGLPSLNRHQLSQPATSLLYPYFLSFFAAGSKALMPLVALITGLVSMVGVAWMICAVQASRWRIALLMILFLNASTVQYLYSGWEHLPQAALLVLFLWMFRRFIESTSVAWGIASGLTGALAIGLRADSVLLLLPFMLLRSAGRSRMSNWPMFVGGLVAGALLLLLQLESFGWLTPTTARLKAGGGYDVWVSLKFLMTSLATGSALLVCSLTWMLLWWQRKQISPPGHAMMFSLGIFIAYGVYVADVFPAARMFLPAMCMSLYTLATEIKAFATLAEQRVKLVVAVVVGLSVTAMGAQDLIKSRLVDPQTRNWHPMVEHLMMARVIDQRLNPVHDVVGLFWLGAASYELSSYEVSDFLGKGDEMIARLPKKWGMPGHNKWDIEKSIDFHHPSLIIARADIHYKPRNLRAAAVERKADWAFWDDFYEASSVQSGYLYCQPTWAKEFGFVLRRDKAVLFSDICPTLEVP
jgi:hypothetical protein